MNQNTSGSVSSSPNCGGCSKESAASKATGSDSTFQTSSLPCRGSVDPHELLAAAAALAVLLSKGKTRCEIETLVNLFSLTTDNLQAILAQVSINERAPNVDLLL